MINAIPAARGLQLRGYLLLPWSASGRPLLSSAFGACNPTRWEAIGGPRPRALATPAEPRGGGPEGEDFAAAEPPPAKRTSAISARTWWGPTLDPRTGSDLPPASSLWRRSAQLGRTRHTMNSRSARSGAAEPAPEPAPEPAAEREPVHLALDGGLGKSPSLFDDLQSLRRGLTKFSAVYKH
jgi:hypothetical protein